MRILVFDNYDSFTYNLVQLVKKVVDAPVDVFRNDAIALEEVDQYDKIILSPGPGIPEEAGNLIPLIKSYAHKKSILGVCLGHQAIGCAFGATLQNLSTVYHGISTRMSTAGKDDSLAHSPLFDGMPPEFEIGRYHSWIVREETLPACLEITAKDQNGFIMGMQHRVFDVQGIQFHPESVLTPLGEVIMRNWLKG